MVQRANTTFSGSNAPRPTATTQGRIKTFSPVDGLVMERMLNPKYFTHFERFLQLPGINGDLASATEATRMPVNRNIELVGTNAASALATFAANGGCTLTTDTADNDQMIIQSHSDTKQSALDQISWNTAKEPMLMANIVTGAAITTETIFAGWRLVETDSSATGDDDKAIFRYAAADNADWEAITSVGGTDVEADSDVTVALSSLYRLLVVLDRNRVPRYYINDTLVATGATMTALATLRMAIGIHTNVAGARAMTVRNFMVSQLL